MNDTINLFQKYLRSKKLKCTPEREEILALILSMSGAHFEADDILTTLRKKKSKIAKGTIYRTLKHLVDAGILRSVIFVDRHAHYEVVAGHKRHSHLVCIKCGKIIEFFDSKIYSALAAIAKKNGFTESGRKVEVTGFCRRCK